MENIIFYSTHCPKCKVIEVKMKQKYIDYTEVNDVDKMLELGIKSAPYLEVNGELLDFSAALKWINEQRDRGHDFEYKH